MTSIKALLNKLIDYAGLFPPAALPLPAVIKNYQKYVAGPNNWMLGRLIIPAARLPELVSVFDKLLPKGVGKNRWKISALIPEVDGDDNAFEKGLAAIAVFNERSRHAHVDTVEGKIRRVEQIPATLEPIPVSLTAFFELPLDQCEGYIESLAAPRADRIFAKVRTGGVTAAMIPNVQQVSRFIACCAANNLGFKATAGLHHPVRADNRLSYDFDADRGIMHGFLNVFVAACFAKTCGWSAGQVVDVLECTDPDSFVFTDEAIDFGEHRLSLEQVRRTREDFAISFGSCSFTEPVAEIQRPGWLEQSNRAPAN